MMLKSRYTLTFVLPSALRERLSEYVQAVASAACRNVSIGEVVRQAISHYIDTVSPSSAAAACGRRRSYNKRSKNENHK